MLLNTLHNSSSMSHIVFRQIEENQKQFCHFRYGEQNRLLCLNQHNGKEVGIERLWCHFSWTTSTLQYLEFSLQHGIKNRFNITCSNVIADINVTLHIMLQW